MTSLRLLAYMGETGLSGFVAEWQIIVVAVVAVVLVLVVVVLVVV